MPLRIDQYFERGEGANTKQLTAVAVQHDMSSNCSETGMSCLPGHYNFAPAQFVNSGTSAN